MPKPQAKKLVEYWQNNVGAYATHYVLDDMVIYHTIPDNYRCWHVGSPGNSKYLGIEMCEPSQIKYTSGSSFTVSNLTAARTYAEACCKNAVWLLAKRCKAHGWDPQSAVWTHGEITRRGMSKTDHVDPEHLWNGLGLGYDLAKLRRDVAAAMGGANATTEASQLYRVRKSWTDAASQIGAFTSLDYAKAACKAGYAVFNAQGAQVWPEAAFVPYLVRVTASEFNVRKGPGVSYGIAMTIPKGGAYTIMETKDGWGKLKSGAGWISLKYTEKA